MQRIRLAGLGDADDRPRVVQPGPGHRTAGPAERIQVGEHAVLPEHRAPGAIGLGGPAGDPALAVDGHAPALAAAGDRGEPGHLVVHRGSRGLLLMGLSDLGWVATAVRCGNQDGARDGAHGGSPAGIG